jgi:DNA-binding response OmpR family regulator
MFKPRNNQTMNTPQVRLKALVAEDDRALADIIRLALTRAGFDVSVAHDGQKAQQLAQSVQFDVVVSDYQMPIVNGEKLLASIRASSMSREALLILCSAKSYELNSERLRDELRLSAIFYKPFSLSEVVSVARQAKNLSDASRLDACVPSVPS